MSYDRYWDLPEYDRALLTEEAVGVYVDVELMEAGVLKPKPLVLEPTAPPDLDTEMYYQICHSGTSWSKNHLDILFRNPTDARTFVDEYVKEGLVRVRGYDGRAIASEITDATIDSEELASGQDVLAHQAELKDYDAAKSRNTKVKEAYEADVKAVDSASRDIWNDWRECRQKETHYAKIRTTHEAYLKMSDGDKKVALRFLRKAYEDDDVATALDIEINDDEKALEPETSPAGSEPNVDPETDISF